MSKKIDPVPAADAEKSLITVILTGGKSRRMGRDKALLEAGNKTFSLMLAERYGMALGKVFFSVNARDRFPAGEYPVLEDHFPGAGPLNGLYSGFRDTDAEFVFLTATDMPNGAPGLVKVLLERMGTGDACAIRRRTGRIEPLFAVYSRRCSSFVQEYLSSGGRRMLDIFTAVDTRLIEEEKLPAWDLDHILMNLNTPEDYALYQKSSSYMREDMDGSRH